MFKINIISHSSKYSAENIIAEYTQMLTAKKIYGWRMNIDIEQVINEEKIFSVSGGSANFSEKKFQFVTIPLPCKALMVNKRQILEWAKKFDVLVEVVDLSVMENNDYLQNAGEAHYAMSIVEQQKQAFVLAMGCETVLEPFEKTDDINFEQYTNIIQGIHSAVSGQDFRGIQLKNDKRKAVADFLYTYFHANNHFFTTEMRNELQIRLRFFCNHKDLHFSGYFESIFAILNHMYINEIKNGIEFNNVINNKIYNLMTFNKLKSFLGCSQNSIKLAVIGSTSSGKTFLLRDIILALKAIRNDNNGYDYRSDSAIAYFDGGSKKYGNIVDFVKENRSDINTTPRYFARQKHHYKSTMSSCKTYLPNFPLEIMNIPGEAFLYKIEDFNVLKKAVEDAKNKTFTQEVWVSRNGNDKQLLVRYGTETTKEIAPKTDSDESLETLKISKYLSYEEWVAYLKKDGYTKQNKGKQINGKTLWKNFYQYEPDTFINAVKTFMENEHNDKIQSNFTENNNSILDQYLSRFYFFYFCYYASDVIVVDKLAVSEDEKIKAKAKDKPYKSQDDAKKTDEHKNKDEKSSNESKKSVQDTVLEGLKIFFKDECKSGKKFYLVFRGLDALLKQEKLQLIFGQDITHTQKYLIYSILTILLYRKYFEENNMVNAAEPLNNFLNTFSQENNIENLKGYFGNDFTEELKQFLSQLAKKKGEQKEKNTESQVQWQDLFGKHGTDYFVPDSDNSEKNPTPTVWERIENRIGICEYLSEATNISTNILVKPHIYFTAFPVNSRTLKISKNNGEGKFDPELNTSQSLLLGTNELVVDILKNSIKDFQWNENNTEIPLLMQNMFDNNN